MDCADCALTLEKILAKMQILGDVDEEKVRKQIKSLGYGVTDIGQRPQILKVRL